jgi:hypothetical protein
MDPGHVLLLSWWLGTEFSAAVASLNVGGANFGSVYTIGQRAFCVDLAVANMTGANLGFRNTPNMDDKCGQGISVKDASVVVATHQIDDWIQVAESRWLPKKFLVEIDTTVPCAFQTLCDALKKSKVTEVDFSSCGLGSQATEILSEYVREATAALVKIDVRNNELDANSLKALKSVASQECEVLCD